MLAASVRRQPSGVHIIRGASVLLTVGVTCSQGLGGCVCLPINKLTSVCWSDAWFARCRLFGWFLAVFVRCDWPVAARRARRWGWLAGWLAGAPRRAGREWCDEKDRAVPAGTLESHGGLRCPLSHYCARCVISVVAVTRRYTSVKLGISRLLRILRRRCARENQEKNRCGGRRRHNSAGGVAVG